MKTIVLSTEQFEMVRKLVNANLQCNLGQADRETGAEKTKCLSRAKMSDDVLNEMEIAK